MAQKSLLTCCTSLGILVAAWLFFGMVSSSPADGAEPSDSVARAFFAAHCQGCHSGGKPKGDFGLESLSHDFSQKPTRGRWLSIIEQLTSGNMPPAGKPPPPGIRHCAISS
jgi:mono/diheme cytochrome c family protein